MTYHALRLNAYPKSNRAFYYSGLNNPWIQRVMWFRMWIVSWQRHLNSISLCLYLLFRFFYSIIFILTCNSLHTRKTSYITNRSKLFFHRRTFDEGQTKNISVSNKSVSRQSFALQTELIPRFIFSRKFQWNFHAAFEYNLFSVCWVAFFLLRKKKTNWEKL